MEFPDRGPHELDIRGVLMDYVGGASQLPVECCLCCRGLRTCGELSSCFFGGHLSRLRPTRIAKTFLRPHTPNLDTSSAVWSQNAWRVALVEEVHTTNEGRMVSYPMLHLKTRARRNK